MDPAPDLATLQDPLRGHFVKSRVVEAAIDVFTRQGVAATTVEDILRTAGVSRRTFYRFFSNKDDVLDALHKVWSSLFTERLITVIEATPDPWVRLERVTDTYLGFARANAAVMRILNAAAHRPGSPMAARRSSIMQRFSLRLAKSLRDTLGLNVDPFLLQGLLIAQEGIVDAMLVEEPIDDGTVARARAAMIRIMGATLSGQGAHLPPLPTLPAPHSLARAQ
jgi:AcrR family transcriptional regulator